jgi:hypothetical protein
MVLISAYIHSFHKNIICKFIDYKNSFNWFKKHIRISRNCIRTCSGSNTYNFIRYTFIGRQYIINIVVNDNLMLSKIFK